MKLLSLQSGLNQFETCNAFLEEFKINKNDLIITCSYIYDDFFKKYDLPAQIIFQDRYGAGEPSDEMITDMIAAIDQNRPYERIFGIGGGTVMDISKLFALKQMTPLVELFTGKIAPEKKCPLILVPTTCGTGSEVTNVSIVGFPSLDTKLRLAADALYADEAVLIPELTKHLPRHVFATSSIDALIHAIESYLSPKANPFTEMFSVEAIKLILHGYQEIVAHGEAARNEHIKEFLLASTYAGIAFGNAGCAAVHAMSMPFSGTYHVPHGEANYVVFTEVFKVYNRLAPDGKIRILNELLTSIVGGDGSDVYERLETLLSAILPKKTLKEYGVKEEELAVFTENVMTKQGRLTANNYTPLSKEEVYGIYRNLYE